MLLPFWVVLCFLFLPTRTLAATESLDSLRIQASSHPNDTLGWEAMLTIAQSYFGTNLDSSLAIAEKVRNRSSQANHQDFMARSENIMGIAHLYQDDNQAALNHFQAVLEIRKQQNVPELIAGASNNVALAYQNLGQTGLALDYHIRSLKIKEELGDSTRIRVSLNNIGLIYENLNDYPKAREYYRQALAIFPLERDSVAYLTNLYNIGITHFKEEANDSARSYFHQGMPIALAKGDQRMIGLHHMHFGVLDQRNGNRDLAREQIQLALDLFTSLGKKDQMAASLTYLGLIALESGQASSAVRQCKNALQLARETSNLEKEIRCLDCLEQAYRKTGNTAMAYSSLRELRLLEKNIDSENAHKEIVRKDLEYGFRKQQLADSMETARKQALVNLKYENSIKQRDADLDRQRTMTFFFIVI